MNPRILLIVFLAVGGLGGFLFFRALTRPVVQPKAPPPIPVERVLVATHAFQVGDFVRGDDSFVTKVLPRSELPEGAVKDTKADRKSVHGAVVIGAIEPGNILRSSQVLPVGAPGFLPAALKPNMRAVSIQVTPVSSVGGLVEPGDHVDLILTQSFHSGSAPPSVVARGVAAGVRVIAVDQTFLPPDILSAESGSEGPLHNNKPSVPPAPPTTVTLEVTPEQAVAITVAAEMGHLSLAIQSSHRHDQLLAPEVKDNQVGDVPDFGAKTVGNVSAVNDGGTTVHVYNGTAGSLNVQF
ncbi:Flp pilus assembly protein CpaB [Acetobacter ghanensis]|uniref:Flp pilus assembly protein CpaB n=1 Tax=Acetobacter ghanensis TaxID=431306 RepID=A0A0U5F348_9PROT|nr:Flp pilus assembly protein CpaB [Acetobacter ghanensis]NHO40118.1 Flp pilus assembly protein CpaB [Acetobacter ghanensis]GBQ45749.1 Flp pilus assembly CpaB [Acetobacter ghanensis DSM 18895]CEF54139.1 putative pilus assembly protein [Acetobacter ghanensis]